MPLVEWALNAPMGHCWPKEEYASVIASIIHLDSLCFVTGDPLVRSPKNTKSCSDCLKGAECSISILNALTGQSRFNPWSCSEVGSSERVITLVSGRSYNQDDPSACISPIYFTDATASSRVVFSVRGRRSTDFSSSNRGLFSALNTVGRSHVWTVAGQGRISLLDPFKKRATRLFLPTNLPSIGVCESTIAAT